MTEQICPYCRTAISDQDEVNICPACDTPHHLDCWEENRGCTVFGCSMAPPDEEKIDVEVETRREEDTRETPQAPMPEEQKVAPGAILSIVLGVVGFFYVWGLLFGGLAIYKAIQARKLIKLNPNEHKGLGLSHVGFAIGAITFTVWAMLLLAGASDFGEALIVNLVLLFPVVLIFFSKSKDFFLQKANQLRIKLSCKLITYLLQKGELSRAVNEIRVLIKRNARQELHEMLDALLRSLKAARENLNSAFSLYGTDAEVKNYIEGVISELEQINQKLGNNEASLDLLSENFQSELSAFLVRIRLDERLKFLLKESKLLSNQANAAIRLLDKKQYAGLSIRLGEISRIKSSKILLKEFFCKLESLCQEQLRCAEALTEKGEKALEERKLSLAAEVFELAISHVSDYEEAKQGLSAATGRLKQSETYFATSKQEYNKDNYWGYRRALKYARLVAELDEPLGLEAKKLISAASEQLQIRNKVIRKKAFVSSILFCVLCLLSAGAYVKYEEWRIETEFDKMMIDIETSSDFQKSLENLQQFKSEELSDPYASISDQDEQIPIAIKISKIIYAANEQQLKILEEEAENKIRWLEYKIDQNEYEQILALVDNAESFDDKIAILENNLQKIDTDEFRESLKEDLDFFKAEKYKTEFRAFTDDIDAIILDYDLEAAKSKISDLLRKSDDENRIAYLRLEIRSINEAIEERDYQKAKQASMDFPDEKMSLCMQYMKEHPTGKYRDEIESIIGETQKEIDRRAFEKEYKALMAKVNEFENAGEFEKGISLLETFNSKYPNSSKIQLTAQYILKLKDKIEKRDFYYIASINDSQHLRKIRACQKYLNLHPKGKYTEEVQSVVDEIQKRYFVDVFQEKRASITKRRDWKQGLSFAGESLSILKNTKYEGDILAFQALCRMMADVQDTMARLKNKAKNAGSYEKAMDVYLSYLNSNKEIEKQLRDEIEKQIHELQEKINTQKDWRNIHHYTTNRNNPIDVRIFKLEQYIALHPLSPYKENAQSVLQNLLSEKRYIEEEMEWENIYDLCVNSHESYCYRKENLQKYLENAPRRFSEQAAFLLKQLTELCHEEQLSEKYSNDRYTYERGIVRDEKTGLMWVAVDSYQDLGRLITWMEARDYVWSLEIDGYSDWRMPTRDELLEIYKQQPYFPFTQFEWYWTDRTYRHLYNDRMFIFSDVVTTEPEAYLRARLFIDRKLLDEQGAVRAVR